MSHAHPHDFVGGGLGYVLSVKLDGAALCRDESRYCIENGCLAGAVCAYEGYNLALVYLKGYALDGSDDAVAYL